MSQDKKNYAQKNDARLYSALISNAGDAGFEPRYQQGLTRPRKRCNAWRLVTVPYFNHG
jgi:hypothetical protein